VGLRVGESDVGVKVGCVVGMTVGDGDGLMDGCSVGELEGV